MATTNDHGGVWDHELLEELSRKLGVDEKMIRENVRYLMERLGPSLVST